MVVTTEIPVARRSFEDRVAVSLDDLAERVQKVKDSGDRVVLTSGSFDLIHIGHIRYLDRAKACGNYLVVGVDDDAKIRRRKTADRPLVPEDERLEMLTYQDPVDLVYLKREADERWGLIKATRPDVLVLTADHEYDDDELVALRQQCGDIEVLDRQASVTTSARLHKICLQLAPMLHPQLADTLPEWILPELEQVMAEIFEQVMAETLQQVMGEVLQQGMVAFERKLRGVLHEKLVSGLPELIESALSRR